MTNLGHDRTQLFNMATQAKDAISADKLDVVADRGYRKREEIRDGDDARITTYLPRPQTSRNMAKGRFSKRDFIYIANGDECQCPAGRRLIWRFKIEENGLAVHQYCTDHRHAAALRSSRSVSPAHTGA